MILQAGEGGPTSSWSGGSVYSCTVEVPAKITGWGKFQSIHADLFILIVAIFLIAFFVYWVTLYVKVDRYRAETERIKTTQDHAYNMADLELQDEDEDGEEG